MRKLIGLLLLIGGFLYLPAQNFSLNTSLLNFGDGFETETDSLMLSITNLDDKSLSLSLQLGEIYGSTPFYVANDQLVLPAQGTLDIWVYFRPIHNVLHNSELILSAERGGSLRVDLRGSGKYSNPYYQRTDRLDEQELKDSLKVILAENYIQLSYNQARDNMFMDIDNKRVNGQGAAVNTLEGVYTGAPATNYANRSAAQSQGFNTEHTFPQSTFSSNLPMRSDIHHLFPTDQNANSTRANLPFGVVSNAGWSVGGSKQGNGVFEPRDVQKGATARGMLYFLLRYQNFQNYVSAAEEAVLRQWNADFVPTAIDLRRNDDVESFQGNRNPLVDYPQFADRISNFRSNSVAPQIISLALPLESMVYDTISAGDGSRFSFVIFNDGNQALNLSQLSLSDPELSFVGGSGNDVTVPVGDAHAVVIEANISTPGAFTASLSFQTNASQGNQTVPISAFVLAANQIESAFDTDLRLYTFNHQLKITVEGIKGLFSGKMISL
ncbi:MAG: endonuclease, partial [Bacteroidota bacterium]